MQPATTTVAAKPVIARKVAASHETQVNDRPSSPPHATANAIAMRQLGITRIDDGNRLVGGLSGGERQALAIARAVHFGASVLILDEPTAALGVKEAAHVLRIILQARKKGIAVIFITHNAHHAYLIGDRFTVLERGRSSGTVTREETTIDELENKMAGGKELERLNREFSRAAGPGG